MPLGSCKAKHENGRGNILSRTTKNAKQAVQLRGNGVGVGAAAVGGRVDARGNGSAEPHAIARRTQAPRGHEA